MFGHGTDEAENRFLIDRQYIWYCRFLINSLLFVSWATQIKFDNLFLFDGIYSIAVAPPDREATGYHF